MTSRPHILLVGCGKMGAALLRGWLAADVVAKVSVLEPNPLPFTHARVHHTHSVNEITGADMIVLAVKPQILKDVCAAIKPHIAKDAPVLSIAAGQTMATLQSGFYPGQPVIRAMPNLPASVGAGITAACANKQAAAHKHTAAMLLEAVGACLWLEDEVMLDAVTAVSGSGPAYVFYLIEALADAAMKAGLPAGIAMQLARQTAIGAARLADADKDTPAGTLRETVTSKGGTTEAALSVLMDGRFQEILTEAVAAAAKRSKELSQ